MINIGERAFEGCKNVADLTLGDNVEVIGFSAFSSCNLTSVVIPASVTSIGDRAFEGSKNLTEVTSLIPAEKLFAIPDRVITMTNAGKRKGIYKLYVPIGAKETYEATDGWRAFSEIIEVDLTAIDEVAADGSAGFSNVCYDLGGRVVKNPANGIYILDGRKIFVK